MAEKRPSAARRDSHEHGIQVRLGASGGRRSDIVRQAFDALLRKTRTSQSRHDRNAGRSTSSGLTLVSSQFDMRWP